MTSVVLKDLPEGNGQRSFLLCLHPLSETWDPATSTKSLSLYLSVTTYAVDYSFPVKILLCEFCNTVDIYVLWMVAHTCNPLTQQAEAGEPPGAQG